MKLLLSLAVAAGTSWAAAASPPSPAAANATTSWHLVWTGGQSNSVGTNSQKNGYPSR